MPPARDIEINFLPKLRCAIEIDLYPLNFHVNVLNQNLIRR